MNNNNNCIIIIITIIIIIIIITIIIIIIITIIIVINYIELFLPIFTNHSVQLQLDSGFVVICRTEPDGGRKWLMAYAPIGAKGIYIYICGHPIL